MARENYNLTGVRFGEQADFETEAGDYTLSFGWINTCDVSIDRDINQYKGVKGGTTGHLVDKNIQLLTRVTGSLTFQPSDLKFFKYVLGNYSEAGGNFNITTSQSIPVFLSLKGNYSNTKSLKLTGLALNNCKFGVQEGELVEVSCDFTAQTVSIITEAQEYVQPTTNPLTYLDGSLVYGGTDILLNNGNISMDLKTSPKRNFELIAADKKYYISSIIRTGFNVSFNGEIEIDTDYDPLQKFLGGVNGNTLKEDFDIVLNFNNGTKTSSITIKNNIDTSFKHLFTGDTENVKTYSVDTVAIDVTSTGEL
jgi:hypothetical protein